jgi:signal peptidase I
VVRRALVAVALLLLAAGVWWLWPATLGGRTTYLVTQGVSMEPRFHSGDLALVRPASGYAVGDVVAYRGETLHTVLLHRIVAVEGGRFRLRGDNNSWLDPDRVPPSDVLGRLAGRVPRGGDLLLQVRQPIVLVLGSLLVTLGTALLRLTLRGRPRRVGHATRSKSRSPGRRWAYGGRPRRAEGAGQSQPPAPSDKAPRLLSHAIMVTASASAALLSVGLLAWVVPATHVDSHPVAYTQRAALTYRASVPASPAYPTGKVVTGDPVYLALVPALDVAASYRVTTSAAVALRGTRSVDAVLSTPDGWSRTVPLVPAGPFRGNAFDVTAHLDLTEFARVIRDVAAATHVPIGGYTLTVRLGVHLAGAVAGQTVDQRISPALAFSVDDHLVRLTQSQSGTPATGEPQPSDESAAGGSGSDGPVGRSQVTETAASVRVPDRVPASFTLRGHRVLATELRWWPPAVGGILLLVCLGLGLAGRARRQGRVDDEFGPLTRYEPHLLHTEPVAPADGRTVIDLDSIDALARVAERYERFILHSESGPEHNFLVDDGTTLYRYRTEEAVEAADSVPLPPTLPRQRTPWEATPDAAPAAPPRDVGDQVTAFVERLRRRAVDQD